MTIFGLDISHHQKGINLRTAFAPSRYEFLILKMTEGAHTKDSMFRQYLNQAKELGLLVTGYHWVHGDSSAAAQVKNVLEALGEDRDIPVMLDVERSASGSARWDDVIAIRQALRTAGLKVGLLYLPEWYWTEIGRPNVDAFALYQSDYGSNNGVYPGDNSTRWNYGNGHRPIMLQFTSAGHSEGYRGNLDINAFKGTRADLVKTGLFKDYRKKETPVKKPTQAVKGQNAVQSHRKEIGAALSALEKALASAKKGIPTSRALVHERLDDEIHHASEIRAIHKAGPTS